MTATPGPAPADDLDDPEGLHRAAPAWAAEHGLAFVPASLTGRGSHPCVEIDAETMTARQFTELAAAIAQPRALYGHSQAFQADDYLLDADPDEETDDAQQRAQQVAALRKQAAAHEDSFCTTHLAFMAGPTLHRWTVDASWFTLWLSDVHCLQPDTDTEYEGRPDDEAVQQLATQLAALPAFRIAPRHRRLKIAASTLTAQHDGGSLPGDTVRWAADMAARQVDEDAEDVFQDVEDNQLPQLAAELARDPQYIHATKADVRRHRAQQFLAARTGYQPRAMTIALLLDTPPLQRASRGAAPAGDALFT